MPQRSNESQINLAIQAIQKDPKLAVRRAASIFHVAESTLRHRMSGRRARTDIPSNSRRLTNLEENVIATYIIDLDSRGFAPRIPDVEEMANVVLAARNALGIELR